MKVQDRQNGPSSLPEKTGWLHAWPVYHYWMIVNLEGVGKVTEPSIRLRNYVIIKWLLF